MTISTFLTSLLVGSPTQAAVPIRDQCPTRRTAFSTSEIAVPASILRNRVAAKWIRHDGIEIDVRSGDELAAATAARIRPSRVTVHAGTLSVPELRAAVRLAVGHIVVGSPRQVLLLRSMVVHRPQHVLLGSTDIRSAAGADRGGFGAAAVAEAINNHPLLHLAGFHTEIGFHDGAFISCPAAIGQMIGEMAEVRDRYGVVLSRLSLGVDRASTTATVDLTQRFAQIDTALSDACGTLRFPVPSMVVSATVSAVGRSAA